MVLRAYFGPGYSIHNTYTYTHTQGPCVFRFVPFERLSRPSAVPPGAAGLPENTLFPPQLGVLWRNTRNPVKNNIPEEPNPGAPAGPSRSRRKGLNITEKASPEKSTPEKIRVELNVEKWPALWRPARAKGGGPRVRILEREFTTSTGVRGTSKLEIGFTQFGTVSTEDQRMFYALIRLWEECGKPTDRPVFFSDRKLAKLLRKKGWGTNVIESIATSLRRLRTTPLRWINSYHRNDGSGKTVEEETIFNFLDQLKIVTRREHGHVTNRQGYFQFSRDILQNLSTNYTKPLFHNEFFQLQTDIGQLLYTHVDLIMADKTRYERYSKDLFSDLGLLAENPSYRYASNRLQALEKPIAELTGKQLSTGQLNSIAAERAEDANDFKLVFIKSKITPAELRPAIESPAAIELPATPLDRPKSPQAVEAGQLVMYFHQRFFGIENTMPTSKELDQASALIARYGAEQSRHVVDYAFGKAQQTRFAVQHFGAILNYAPRAIAYLDGIREAGEYAQKVLEQQERALQKDLERQAWGEAQLAALAPEEYKIRFKQAQSELYAEYPRLGQFRGRQSDKIHEEMIRVRIIRQLEQEQTPGFSPEEL